MSEEKEVYCPLEGYKRLKGRGLDNLTSVKIAQETYRRVKKAYEGIRTTESPCNCEMDTPSK